MTGIRRAQAFCGIASALTALAVLGALLVIPAYGGFTCTLDSTGREECTSGTRSFLDVNGLGVLVTLGVVALGFAVVAVGSFLDARGWRHGRWLALAPTIALTALSAISFGLGPALYVPVLLAWVSVLLGFAKP